MHDVPRGGGEPQRHQLGQDGVAGRGDRLLHRDREARAVAEVVRDDADEPDERGAPPVHRREDERVVDPGLVGGQARAGPHEGARAPQVGGVEHPDAARGPMVGDRVDEDHGVALDEVVDEVEPRGAEVEHLHALGEREVGLEAGDDGRADAVVAAQDVPEAEDGDPHRTRTFAISRPEAS